MREIKEGVKYLPFNQFTYWIQVCDAVDLLFKSFANFCLLVCIVASFLVGNPVPIAIGFLLFFWLRNLGNRLFGVLYPRREEIGEHDHLLSRDAREDYWENQ